MLTHDPYHEGALARHNGKSEKNNPYVYHSEDGVWWLKGFRNTNYPW